MSPQTAAARTVGAAEPRQNKQISFSRYLTSTAPQLGMEPLLTTDSDEVFERVTKRHPCPRCGRTKYCVLIGQRMLLCTKEQEGAVKPSRDGSGWIHVLRPDLPPPRQVAPKPRAPRSQLDLGPIVAAASASTCPTWLAQVARGLRLPATGVDALRRLGVHRPRYDLAELASSAMTVDANARLHRFIARMNQADYAGFPLTLHNRVVGVRLRNNATGRKLAFPGGREGLALPSSLPRGLDVLAIAEGPTDCAALLSVGIESVGRPSCTGAVDETVWLALTLKPRRVAVIVDRDRPGVEGGVRLAKQLATVVDDVRCVLPPKGFKDARAWVSAGASASEIMSVIEGGRRV